MSFSFSTTDGQSRYMWFDLLGENKQRSPFPPREFPKSPPKSPKPPTTNRGNYMELRFLTISREVTWLILSLSQISIGGDVKESIGEENEKSSASEIWIMTSLHSSWLNLSAPDFYHSISWRTQSVPPSSLPPKSQSAEMWKKSLNHVKLIHDSWFLAAFDNKILGEKEISLGFRIDGITQLQIFKDFRGGHLWHLEVAFQIPNSHKFPQ